MTNDELRDEVLESLAPLPVTARAMFGGYGLYLEGGYFGLIAEGRLYFRTNEATRPYYVRRGMPSFQPASRPRGPRTVAKNFEVPGEVRASRRRLRSWTLRAAEAYKTST
jgi:DNA transformation protein